MFSEKSLKTFGTDFDLPKKDIVYKSPIYVRPKQATYHTIAANYEIESPEPNFVEASAKPMINVN